MNTIRILSLTLLFCLTSSVFPQGSLMPPAAPAPTMKTLDQIEPRTAIPGGSGGYAISVSGSYYLTGDKAIAAGVGIGVNVDNVTVDLGGFQISGGSDGIFIPSGRSNVTIRNGTIRNASVKGINAALATGIRVENVRVFNGNGGISVGDNGALLDCLVRSTSAIGIQGGDNCVIRNCQSIGNTGGGSHGISVGRGAHVSGCLTNNNAGSGINAGDDCVFNNCSSSKNDERGFNLGSRCAVSNCTANVNSTSGIEGFDHLNITGSNVSGNAFIGVYVNSGTVVDCTVNANVADGVRNFGNLPLNVVHCSINDNVNFGVFNDGPGRIEGCTIRGNLGGGIVVESKALVLNNSCDGNGSGVSGIKATGSDNRIEGNNVTNQTTKGFEITAAGNLIIRNSASGNTPNYDIAAGNTVGPTVTSANIATSNNPHANYDF